MPGLWGPGSRVSPSSKRDAVQPQPEHLGRQLGHDGVGARPDVGCAAGDACGAVAADRRTRLASGLVVGEGHPAGHPVADQPAPIAHRTHGRVAPRPAEPVGAHLVALAQGLARPPIRSGGGPRRRCATAARSGPCPARRTARRAATRARSCPPPTRAPASSRSAVWTGPSCRGRRRSGTHRRGRADSQREVGVAGRGRQRLQRCSTSSAAAIEAVETPSWSIATSLPSRVAATLRCCTVLGRRPIPVNICGR